MKKLSVVLATRNEEENIERCLRSVKDIAYEIIICDEHSTDKTTSIAKKYKSKIYFVPHEPIFHITKQKAIDKATGDWVLLLDADEEVSQSLAQEIKQVIEMESEDIKARRPRYPHLARLFAKHIKKLEQRDGKIGHEGEVVAFFVPRRNMFLGGALTYGGVYPDGIIRLFKNNKARLPGKSVHEQMVVDGEVSWLFSDLLHHDSPTLTKYIQRLNRYTDLVAKEYADSQKTRSVWNLAKYTLYDMPFQFSWRFFRGRGFKDGIRGFLWALFSAWQYPLAYYKFYLS